MNVRKTELPEVLVVEPVTYGDERGYFFEPFRQERFRDAGIDTAFVQDNCSMSRRNVLRGLHFQKYQGKLVTVVRGEVFDVAVDIRPDSPRFGKWVSVVLSESNHRQLCIPPGFAHGFCVLSDEAHVWYKATDIYRPEQEGGISWNDPELGIEWPVPDPLISSKDRDNPPLAALDKGKLVTMSELEGR